MTESKVPVMRGGSLVRQQQAIGGTCRDAGEVRKGSPIAAMYLWELLLDEAMRLYPTFAADDPDERLSASDECTDEEEARLESLDESFYRLAEERDLVKHYAAAYVSAHPEGFPT